LLPKVILCSDAGPRTFFGDSMMTTYVIGDLQGCHARLCALIERIEAAQPAGEPAQYVFVGDLVNRGPQSLETLRHLHRMGARARTVLGNHDLHLLAAANGIRKPGRSDTLGAILAAPDREILLDWLRRQPLALLQDGHLVVHAGLLPQWSVAQALALSAEVESALQGPDWIGFLRHMYGNQPTRWDDGLVGADRLRCIVNAMTRMRYCTPDGTMLFDDKKADAADGTAADGTAADEAQRSLPWFDLPQRRSADTTVVFGHWSAIGLQLRPNLIGLDTGCLWGGKLTAVRLQDRALFQVDCPQYQAPAGAGSA
jgi:bis(5'-nucleosyl)-tetraphosphatase (symmetrical)